MTPSSSERSWSAAGPDGSTEVGLATPLFDCGGVTAEDRLLLLAARSGRTDAHLERVESVVPAVADWDYVLEAAVRHSVAPLLHHALLRLSSRRLGAVPPETQSALAALEQTSRARSERLFTVIRTIAGELDRADVPLLALKEIQLAAAVYEDPALRPMGDLDLLIHREDYERAAGVLAGLGFKPHPTPGHPYALRYGMGHHFRRASDDVWIDLQWNVAQREWDVYGEGTFTYDPSQMWERSAAISAHGLNVLAPSGEDMLFHLCLHLEGHAYAELILFSDIAFLLRTTGETLDWDAVVALARSYQAESSIYHALMLTAFLLGVTAPTDVLQQLEPSYFAAGSVPAIFGNVGTLHESLDEINAVVDPPSHLANRLETAVRRQAAEAMLVYRELEAFSQAFFASEGTVLCFDSAPSPRRYPDNRLDAFGDIDAFVLDREVNAIVHVLKESGWTAPEGLMNWRKRIQRQSKDPLLDQVSVDLELTIGSDVGSAVERAPAERSNIQAVLRGLLRRRRRPQRTERVAVRIHALTLNQLVATLAARIVVEPRARLVRLASAWLLFQRLGREVSWPQISELALQLEMESEVGAGLSLASSALGTSAPLQATSHSTAIPRLFASARDVATDRPLRTAVKALYLYMLPLLAQRGARARFGYVRASLKGRDGGALLWRLLRDTAVGAVAQIRTPTTSRRSYWADGPQSSDASDPER
jgi:Uncharacterised nucleotidyltransferase